MKRIKNARVFVELYLGHINIGKTLRIRVQIRTHVKFLHSTGIQVGTGIRVRIRQCE